MEYSKQLILTNRHDKTFRLVGEEADRIGMECYVVGGFVRDLMLGRHSDDLDFVTVGSGIRLAQAVAGRIGPKARLSVFKTYGTAQVRSRGGELEFVGARRESYRRDSRNPIVEDGTLHDDQCRRDFTINAMAIALNKDSYGELLDPFDGMGDLERRIIRTPLDPDITFSDDPLRMMRAVRFAAQLQFDIYPATLASIARNASRIRIITKERVATELMKIIRSPQPSRGFKLLEQTGLLRLIFPELDAMKGVDTSHDRAHKDNFLHTMQVLDNVAEQSDKEWLRWAALLHDIGKPATKRWDPQQGWTFHNHNYMGKKMIPRIFAKMKLPQNEHMKYVMKLVELHMRPIALVEDEVTDSAVRRLLFDAGDDIDDLMTLCKADITSKNQVKVKRFRENFDLVKQKLIDIEEKDRVRNFQPPIDGEDIMNIFGLAPSRPVGLIKDAIKDAILDGKIGNNFAQAYALMLQQAEELGLRPVDHGLMTHTTIDSPLGQLLIAVSHQGVTMVNFGVDKEKLSKLGKRLKLKPTEGMTPLLRHAVDQLCGYFAGTRREFSLPLHRQGTDFQTAAWLELESIPYGATESYRDQAVHIGHPTSFRAVAAADHANPLPIVVPCHRVVAADGSLGGYGGGSERKQWLLDHERK